MISVNICERGLIPPPPNKGIFLHWKKCCLAKKKIFFMYNQMDHNKNYLKPLKGKIKICKKKTVYLVDKLSIYYLLHPVVHKHDFNNICYPLIQPLRWVSSFPLYHLTSSLPFSWVIIILMFKMYNVHCFYLQFSFVYSGPTN